MIDTVLIFLILVADAAILYVEWLNFKMYQSYFNERLKWRQQKREQRKEKASDSVATVGNSP